MPFAVESAVVKPRNDSNYEALREICERHNVRRLDLHGSSFTGEDLPDGQSELNLVVEFLPIDEATYPQLFFSLENDLKNLFGRDDIALLRVDDIKHEYLREVFTRRRTPLYPAKDSPMS